jgi:hypothetical protein
MNLAHLADALDGWKNWIIGQIVPPSGIVMVVPMLTDAACWNDEYRNLYATLLRTVSVNIVSPAITFSHVERAEYFTDAVKQLGVAEYVFVDPDNGPWTSTGPKKNGSEKYVKGEELVQLLGNVSGRVVMAYRHESRSQSVLGLTAYVSELFIRHDAPTTSFGVFCGVTSLILVSRDRARISEIRESIARTIQPVAVYRVTPLVPAGQA